MYFDTTSLLLVSFTLADPAVDAVVSSALKSVKTAREIVNLFNEQSKYIRIEEFKEFLQKMDQFRRYYSPRANGLADEIKTHLKNAIISYIMSSDRVYEWCGLIIPRLESYFHFTGPLAISSKAQAKMQQQIIIRILERGSLKMAIAQEKLNRATENFNKAYGSISALVAQLNVDFNPNGDFVKERAYRLIDTDRNELYTNSHDRRGAFGLRKILKRMHFNIKKYHEKIRNALRTAYNKIEETKSKLHDKILAINDVKFQTVASLTTINDDIDMNKLDKVIEKEIKSAMKQLVEESRRYQDRHIDQKKSLFSYIQA